MQNASTSSYTLLEPLYDGVVKVYDLQASGLSLYLSDITRYFFMIIAVIAAFYLIYGGIQYLTVDISSLKLEGKETIKRVIIGLIFIFSIWTIFNAINPDLLKSGVDFGAYTISKDAKSPGSDSGSGGAAQVPNVPAGNYNWPVGSVTGNGVVCNGGKKSRSINATACADPYKSYIEKYSAMYGVDKNIIRAVMWQESNTNPNIGVSPAGAIGMMQITPATASGIGCKFGWQTDPEKNIECGTRYLKQGQSKGYSTYDLYAGYNGGYGGNSMSASSDCPGLKRWQCSFDNSAHSVCNTGFSESRNYAVEGVVWQKTFTEGKMCSW